MNITVKKLPKSEVEIEGELEAPIFEGYYATALKKLGEHLEFAGFRKGKAPENVVLAKVGEMHVLEELAELALGEHYPKIIEENKLDVVGRPEIAITKLARNNPLGFKIKTAVLPEFKLPDYKKIGKSTIAGLTDADKSTEVTDKELEDTIMDIRKSRAPKVHMAEGEEKKDEMPQELPELTEEFVKGLGPFTGIEDFKTKLKENIKLEKQNQVREKTRLKIIEKIIEETSIDTPEILIESELTKILYRMESDITQMGLKFDEYLKHLNKTKDDLKKEFRGDAEKKAKLGLVMNEIAKTEKIEANQEEVAKEVAHILEHYKDADPTRAQMHAENVLTNEKIFQFLESQ
ncbi:MAG: trigger factor [Patescibacteria group bacterium]